MPHLTAVFLPRQGLHPPHPRKSSGFGGLLAFVFLRSAFDFALPSPAGSGSRLYWVGFAAGAPLLAFSSSSTLLLPLPS